LTEVLANPKFLIAMTQANPKFVMGKPMLTIDALHKTGKPWVELHNYYINNYKSGQDIIVLYKDRHFLVGDNIFSSHGLICMTISTSMRWISL
jgi:hypothetical protein